MAFDLEYVLLCVQFPIVQVKAGIPSQSADSQLPYGQRHFTIN